MAITKAARCLSPCPIPSASHIISTNTNAHRRLECWPGAALPQYHRELQAQSLKCGNLRRNVYWPKREPKTLFCLRRTCFSSSSSSSEQESQINDGHLEKYNMEMQSPETSSLSAKESRWSNVNHSFPGVCSGPSDMHSSTSSIGLTDESLQNMGKESEEMLILEGNGDSPVSENNDLEKNGNENKVMKMERFSHFRESCSGRHVLLPQDLSASKDEKGYWFPYMDKFKSGNVTLSSSEILQGLDPFIVETRKQRIREVVRNRTYSICPVVEGLTDFGNISAVFRSADALGFQSVHVISNDSTKRYRQNRNVSMGSEKWLDIEQWKTTQECFEVLRLRGYRIAVAHIGSDPVSVCDMDWTLPTAIVLGNEHKGVSDEALELSDMRCSISMVGMVDSLNVSVAAGICMHSAVRDRIFRMGSHGDLCPKHCQILTAEFYLRHKKNVTSILDRIAEKESLGEVCLS